MAVLNRKKFIYAVKKGYTPGLYEDWESCKAQVNGFPGAVFKKFTDELEAMAFIGDETAKEFVDDETLSHIDDGATTKPMVAWFEKSEIPDDTIVFYVDGSYNKETGNFGWAVYGITKASDSFMCGQDACVEDGRNVEGEIHAATKALNLFDKAKQYKNAILYYDYAGIESWATGEWQANKKTSKEYQEFFKEIKSHGKNISFQHVKGHTGCKGNELVDKVAKLACGVDLTKDEILFVRPYADRHGFPLDSYANLIQSLTQAKRRNLAAAGFDFEEFEEESQQLNSGSAGNGVEY